MIHIFILPVADIITIRPKFIIKKNVFTHLLNLGGTSLCSVLLLFVPALFRGSLPDAFEFAIL
jgi:galactitol-specific phosphotransferase system IIC component